MGLLASVARAVWLCLRTFVTPSVIGAAASAGPMNRERLRRGQLLATFILISLPLSACLLHTSIYPHAMPAYLVGLTALALLFAVSALCNRRGSVELACWLFLGASVSGCTIGLFFMPHDNVLASIAIYAFYALPVVQAGFLLNRHVPFVVAGVSSVLITAHMISHARHFAVISLSGNLNFFAVGAILITTIFTLALFSWANADNLERAAVLADRTGDVERLYVDLQESHQALEAKNAEVHAQAEEMAALNEELLAMQTELEASYRKLAEANRHLEEQASIDAMTGLANHRVFQQTLRTQTALALRHRQPLTLLMLDIDYFKHYNDRFGHPAGDALLRAVGGILSMTVRAGDLAARYGGEEFAIILPHTELAEAEQVAERIRAAVAARDFPHDRVTLSAGVASLHVHAHDADALVEAADIALYMAKEEGRDCVAVAPPVDPLSQPAPTPDGDDSETGSLTLSNSSDQPAGQPHSIVMHSLMDGFGGIDGLLQEPSGHVLTALLAALDARDAETQGHSQRVARYAMRLATALIAVYDRMREERPLIPWITPGDLHDLALGALLHDIGKIGVPDYILRKSGPLTEEEWAVMRRHPIIGADLVRGFPLLVSARPVVRHHHERWDGHGYPDGLEGEAIPLTARIYAICDAFDAITTDRPYRPARPYAAAREEILKHAGTQFDPIIVQAFLEVPPADWEALKHGNAELSRLRAAA